ncbi:hypothetical protein [Bacillus sp. JCM 19041]|uniref:hypothetical protein n=1 Tax=Bacillus sp. JCM 19041 TaxID=1460637 RepID=UPI0006D0C193
MYSMKIDEKKKVFSIVVSGFITEDEAAAYATDYKKHAESIHCPSYTLLLDGSGIKASKQDMLDGLKALIQSYVDDQYKEILFVQVESPTARSQMRRIDVLMNNVRIIEPTEIP